MATNEDVLRKVRALLARTVENGATEAEAETSMKLAQKLLADNNLVMAEAEPEVFQSDVIHLTLDKVNGHAWGGRWWVVLGQAVGKATFTKFYRSMPNEKPAVTFVGSHTDTQAAQEMYVWLNKCACDFAALRRKEFGIGWCTKEEMPFTREYLVGFASGLYDRLSQTQDETAGSALILMTDAKAKQYMEQRFTVGQVKTKTVRKTMQEMNWQRTGHRDAYEVNLHNSPRIKE